MLVSSPNLFINLPSHILPYWKSYCLHFQNVWRSNTSQHLHCLPTGLSIIIICLIYYPILVTSSHASTHPHVVHSLQRNQTETFKIPSMYYGEGNGTPLQYSCLENPMGGGAWWAAVHGVTKSWTWLSDFAFTFMHWRRKWQPTPVFLPRESHGQRGLVGCRLWGRTESDTTEAT